MLPSDGKRGRFLEASGSNDGKYPILWQTDRTHSHEPSGLLGGFWRESVIATKALEMSHFRRAAELERERGCQICSHSLPSPPLHSSVPGWEMVGDSLHSSSSREIRLSWSWISSQICSAEKKCLRRGKKGGSRQQIEFHTIPSLLHTLTTTQGCHV